jgi:hypothetical protein
VKIKPFNLPNAGRSGSVLNISSMHKEFVRRLESYATAQNITLGGNGYRSILDQASAWLAYQTDPAHNNLAAYPGESWHGVGCAYDAQRVGNDADGTGHYPATMEADFLVAPEQQQLYKWGLCIPMWNGSGSKENWHIQPIETLGVSGSARQWFLEEDDLLNTVSGYRILREIILPNWGTRPVVYMKGNDVKRFQRAVKLDVIDGWFGKDSTAAAIALQTGNGLTPDGLVGNGTWAVAEKLLLAQTPPPTDYKALYEQTATELANTIKVLDVANNTISSTIQELQVAKNGNAILSTENTRLQIITDGLKNTNAQLVLDNTDYKKDLEGMAIAYDLWKKIADKY